MTIATDPITQFWQQRLKSDVAKRGPQTLERQQQVGRNRIARAYRAQVRTARRRTSIAAIERALRAGNTQRAIELTLFDSAEMAIAIQNAYVSAGEAQARQIADRQSRRFSFDRTSLRANGELRSIRQRAVEHFDNQQQQASRAILDDAIARGLGPRQQARALYDAIGLDAHRARDVIRYRQQLQTGDERALGRQRRDQRFDSTVRRAVEGGDRLNAAQVNRMVSRYQVRLLSARQEVIAATESTQAIEMGASRAREQAIEEGLIDRNDTILVWVTHEDERVRGSHRAMHGQQRRQGQTFLSGLGNSLAFPGDPSAPAEDWVNCRCWLQTSLDPK